jgi:hypothetical protein
MKFTVEVEEFWLEEDELADQIVTRVRTDVVRQISERVEAQTQKQITEKITNVINDKIEAQIDAILGDLIATGTILQGKEEVSITDHLKGLFHKNRGWNSAADQIEKFAKKFCEEVKLQYNNAFAGHIVKGMKEQGLLKDEVAQMLLEGSQKQPGQH